MNGIDGYAVIVPNKIARLSVTRHKIKRRVMEAIKTLSLPRAMVIFPKSSAIKMEYKDMRDELARLFSKIKE
jgi:ribonuclease P protein component